MKFGISLRIPKIGWRQLAAGGPDGSRTRVRKPFDKTFFVDSLSIKIPAQNRRQTNYFLQ